MDPNAAYTASLETTRLKKYDGMRLHTPEAMQAHDDLIEWLARGGREPTNWDADNAESYRVMAKRYNDDIAKGLTVDKSFYAFIRSKTGHDDSVKEQ